MYLCCSMKILKWLLIKLSWDFIDETLEWQDIQFL